MRRASGAVGLLGVGDALAHRDPLRDRRRARSAAASIPSSRWSSEMIVHHRERVDAERDERRRRVGAERRRRAPAERPAHRVDGDSLLEGVVARRRPRAACPPPPRCGAPCRGRRAAPAPLRSRRSLAGRVDAHLDLLGRRRGRLPRVELDRRDGGRRTRARRRAAAVAEAGCRAPTRTGAPAGCARSGRTGRRPSRSRARRRGRRPTTSSPARRRGRARGTTSQSGRA